MLLGMETFVVRAWRAEDARAVPHGGHDGLRGVVEHIGSGESRSFRDADELVRFLVGQADEEDPDPGRL
jgi:hypothetical protein